MKIILICSVALLALAVNTVPVWGDSKKQSQATISPLYVEECGGCHIGYPAGLLPERSWRKIMANLEDHFGDNAELDAETHTAIGLYLAKNSSEHSSNEDITEFSESLSSNESPKRITLIPSFIDEHEDIPDRLIKGNDKVKSLSNCHSCHADAEKGILDEDTVNISGYGKWDD